MDRRSALKMLAGALAFAGVATSGSAQASPRLVDTQSAGGRLRLKFDEPLIVRRSTAVIANHDGRRFRARVTFSSDMRTMTVTPASPLPSDVYHVTWRALGRQGGPVEGELHLTY